MQFQRGNIGLFFRGDPTLKLWLPLDADKNDYSGNGYHLGGGGSIIPDKSIPIFNSNGCLYASNTNPNTTGINVGDKFTIMIWLNFISLAGNNQNTGFVGRYTDGSSPYIAYAINYNYPNKTLDGIVAFTDATTISVSTPSAIANNKWYFCSLIWNKPLLSFYVDGNLIGTASSDKTVITSASTRILYTSNQYGQYADGKAKEAGLFLRNLSPQEISQYYNWAIGAPKRKYIFAPSVPEPNFFPFF